MKELLVNSASALDDALLLVLIACLVVDRQFLDDLPAFRAEDGSTVPDIRHVALLPIEEGNEPAGA